MYDGNLVALCASAKRMGRGRGPLRQQWEGEVPLLVSYTRRRRGAHLTPTLSPRKRAERGLGLILALILLLIPPAAADTWPEALTNPQPAEGDLLLPLPCGGIMAFRWVETTVAGNWLDDLQVFMGRASDEASYNEYAHFSYLVGSLSRDGDPARRGYYIGKYEVTADQYAAVMNPDCPAPGPNGRRAAGQVSWFEAVAFTERWSEWLLAEDPDTLPHEGEARAFVRLPTEVEWEFAARGGTAVSEAEFRAALFPMADSLSAYAWTQESRACSGKPQPVGLLQANPLGLHDILGNVEEMTLEPYHANRAGRPHGQVGGFVGRGGSCLMNTAQLRSALRIEYPYFDARRGKATALPFLGFRVVLSAPVAVDAARIEALKEDWGRAVEARGGGEESGTRDPLEVIDQVAADSSDALAKDLLAGALLQLRAERSERNEIAARALQSIIVAGTSLAKTYRDETRRLASLEAQIATLEESLALYPDPDSEGHKQYRRLIQTVEDSIAQLRPQLVLTGASYVEVLLQAAGDYDREARQAQLMVVQSRIQRLAELSRAGDGAAQNEILALSQCFVTQAEHLAESGTEDARAYLDELSAARAAGAAVPDSGCYLP